MSIKPQRGLGAMEPYAPGKSIEAVQREYGLEDIIKLASNENPLGPSPKAVAAIQDALSQLNLYPDSQSCVLRETIAHSLGFDPIQIAVGNGADDIIQQVCLAYLDENSEVLVSRSSFPVYDKFVHTMRATLVKTPLRDYRLDLEAMADAITAKTKLVFVCNPNNPTGTIVTAGEVHTFMDKVPDHVLVIFDEAYYEFVAAAAYPDSLGYLRKGHSNVMTMRTFSKAYGLSGLRLGYAIAAPDVIAPLYQVKGIFTVNLLAQVAGIAAWEDQDFLQKSIEVNRAGLRFFYREFARLGLPYLESHGNFILVNLGPRALNIQQQLLARGIIVRPCNHYDLPEFLRISVGTEVQNARFIVALEEILSKMASGE
ncbi:MAG: histidinol-phosphate transaminase [Anaerolineae bacterium]|nr:histidinol-phosphate transaminase [Anaerolineae bacterium]